MRANPLSLLALQKIEWHQPARMDERSVLARMLDFDDLALPWTTAFIVFQLAPLERRTDGGETGGPGGARSGNGDPFA